MAVKDRQDSGYNRVRGEAWRWGGYVCRFAADFTSSLGQGPSHLQFNGGPPRIAW